MVLRGWGVRVVAVGAGLAVLAGCSGDAEPVVTPTPSPTPTETVVESPSPTPSPTPTALTEEEVVSLLPGVAGEAGFWGAQEFARFFLIESQEMVRRQDGRLFEALSAPDCVFCNASLDVLERHQDEGLRLEGGEFTIVDELADGYCDSASACHIEFNVEIAPAEWVDGAGNVVADSELESLLVAIEVEFNGMFWVASGVGSEERDN